MTPDLCIHRKALKSLTWDICSLWLAVIFLCLTTCISQSKNLCIYWLVPYLFRAMPQRWEAISQAIGLIKLLNKAEIHQSYIVCFFQLTETRVFILLSVQFLSCVWLFATTWIAAHQASLSIINSQSLLKLMSIESVMPSNQLILCCPLLLLPSIFPSIRVFSNESFLASGGNPLQCSCLENPRDGGAWWAVVSGVAQSWTRLKLLSSSSRQSIGASASTSVLQMNLQDWFPLGLTGWISLQSKGLSRVFSNSTLQKHQFFSAQLSL